MKKILQKFTALILVIFLAFPWAIPAFANNASWNKSDELPYAEGEVIIKLKENHNLTTNAVNSDFANDLKNNGATIEKKLPENNIIVAKKEGNIFENVLKNISGAKTDYTTELIEKYANDGRVEYIQPNFIYHSTSLQAYTTNTNLKNSGNISSNAIVTNDPKFGLQWYLKNTWQSVPGMEKWYTDRPWLKDFPWYEAETVRVVSGNYGTPGIDIGYEWALEIYNKAKARNKGAQNVIVGVLGTGVNYKHAEFQGVMWDGSQCKNPNWDYIWGCKYGYNTANDNKDAIQTNAPTLYHETLVASIISGKWNNGIGTMGINPDAKIMGVNVFNSTNTTTLDTIEGIAFAKNNGAKIINYSAGTDMISPSYYDYAYREAIENFPGIFVNSSWNHGRRTDNGNTIVMPSIFNMDFTANGTYYPALTNMVVVGSIDNDSKISWFSDKWNKVVDLFAPGSATVAMGWSIDMATTVQSGADYDIPLGTSFAAPIVAASLAFAASAYPEADIFHLRDVMLETVTKDAQYADFAKTSGRLNLNNFMRALENEYGDPTPIIPPEPVITNPIGKISASQTTWTNQPITLTLTSDKAISTPALWQKVNDTTFTRVVQENGQYSVSLQSADGGKAETSITISNIDTIAPVCGDWSLNPATPTNQPVTATLTNSRDNGGSNIVKATDSCTISTWGGTCTIQIRDNAGNTASCVSPAANQLNNVSPTVIITANPNTWTNKNVVLTLSASKDIQTPEWWTKVNDKVYTKEISENGEYIQTISDTFGNTWEAKISINFIDKDAPISTFISPAQETTSNTTNIDIIFSSKDSGSAISGIATNECKIEGGNWGACSSQWKVALDKEWKNNFYIRSLDKAGNYSKEEMLTVNRDTTGIKIEKIDDVIVPFGETIKDIFIATDEDGKLSVEWLPEWIIFEEKNKKISGTAKKIWKFPVTISSIDANGNQSSLIFTIEIRDTIAPVITMNGPDSVEIPFDENFSDPGATCSDNIDKDCTVTTISDVKPWVAGNYTIEYSAKDSSGNIALKKIRKVRIYFYQIGPGGYSITKPEESKNSDNNKIPDDPFKNEDESGFKFDSAPNNSGSLQENLENLLVGFFEKKYDKNISNYLYNLPVYGIDIEKEILTNEDFGDESYKKISTILREEHTHRYTKLVLMDRYINTYNEIIAENDAALKDNSVKMTIENKIKKEKYEKDRDAIKNLRKQLLESL